MKRVWLGILCAALLGVGCGSDDDDTAANSGNDGGSDKPGSSAPAVEKMITAKSGGKVSTTGATLDIPAGALSKDTMVTIDEVDAAKLPDSDMVASTAYDFGPDGTKFEKPVSLTIEFAGKAPKDTVATLAWLDGDKWTALDDSAVKGSSVTATTTHFTTFAVVWISNDDGTGMQTAGACPASEADSTCGGDVIGTWEFDATCVTLPADFLESSQGSDSTLATCKGVKVAANFELTGSITFNKDKTYELHSMTGGTIDASIPKTCLMGAPCPDDWMDNGDACETSMPNNADPNDESGTYAIDGHMLTTTPTDDTPDDPSAFCVKGDVITATAHGADGSVVVYQAKRK